jgi:hypothetical protein
MENSQSKRKNKKNAEIVDALARRGLLPDTEISDEQRRTAKQKRLQKSFHNTELLLKNYRDIAWMVECLPDAVAEELDRPFETVDELLDGIEVSSTFGQRKLEKRLVGVEKTRLMLERVNDALTVLKQKPGNGQMLYNLIYLTYIAPEKLSPEELLFRLNISSRNYYRYRIQAINLLSLRLWSSPDSTVDLWLELLMISES